MTNFIRILLAVTTLSLGCSLSGCDSAAEPTSGKDAGTDAGDAGGNDAAVGDASTPSCGSLQFSESADCQTCAEGACCTELAVCDVGTPCGDLIACVSACSPGDTACTQGCGATNGSGYSDFAALQQCTKSSCASACLDGSICNSGLKSPNTECGACLGTSCCDAYTACVADPACRACVTGSGSNCDSNALVMTTKTCSATSCASACPQGVCDTGQSTGVVMCDACLTTNACAETKACKADATCWTCASTSGAAGCDANAAYQAFTTASNPCNSVCGG